MMSKPNGMITVVVLILFQGLEYGHSCEVQQDDTVESDVKKMEGVWFRVSSKRNGDEHEGNLPKKDARLMAVFKGDSWLRVGKNGELKKTQTIKIDATKSPKQIDVLDADGVKPIAVGIYKLHNNNKLTLCLNIGSKRRPTTFTSMSDEPRDTLVLDVYQRDSPEPK
jgi:uncharacterized protein (TIGR03067 family)